MPEGKCSKGSLGKIYFWERRDVKGAEVDGCSQQLRMEVARERRPPAFFLLLSLPSWSLVHAAKQSSLQALDVEAGFPYAESPRCFLDGLRQHMGEIPECRTIPRPVQQDAKCPL